MVAALILGLLTTIGIVISQFASRTQRQADLQTEDFRQGSQAIARLRRELRGAAIDSPLSGTSTEIVYRYPQIEEGQLVVDESGGQVWQGQARLFFQNDQLLLEKPAGSQPQLLARLEDGLFQVEADDSLVRFTIATKKSLNSPRAFRRQFRLFRSTES